jgi:hypothetical protein
LDNEKLTGRMARARKVKIAALRNFLAFSVHRDHMAAKRMRRAEITAAVSTA